MRSPRAVRRRRSARRRLEAVTDPAAPRRGELATPATLAAGVVAIGLFLLLHSNTGVAAVVAPGVAVATRVALGRVLVRQARIDADRALVRSLPLACDLIGACLVAGASLADAISETAVALGGPLGRELAPVGRALRRGVPDEQAWTVLLGPPTPSPLVALARAAVRAATSGSALEPSLASLAARLRADRAAEGQRAAQRAGVLAVLPLGLCALPAYVLLGVVPAVAGLLHRLR
jgi:Flp pilus assembly protein TadB